MDFEKSYDVIVAGAGVAGVAAALECARAGLQTALVEKTVLLGGLATAGLINIYLPLCDGYGHQAIYGIAEELLRLSIAYGPGRIPEAWARPNRESPVPGPRYMTPFSPAAFVLALDEALVDAGVTLWLDTLVCRPVMASQSDVALSRVVGIEVENKGGRGFLHASVIVDATGDADVAYRAGATCVESDNWLSLWAVEASLAHARKALADPDGLSLLEMVRVGGDADGRNHPVSQPKYSGTDGVQVTRFVLEGRRLLREAYQARQAGLGAEGRHQLFPTALPAMAQFRTTRRIQGLETLSIGESSAYILGSVGLVPDWRRPGPVREVPYGALVPRGVEGLLVAGRCISAEGEAWEISRVIPPAALTGQVAGIAATLAVRQGTPPHEIRAAKIQQVLRTKGMPFHTSDIMQ